MVSGNEAYYDKYKKFDDVDLGKDLGLTAPKKMKTVISLIHRYGHWSERNEVKIADLGGVYGSYKVFKQAFPSSMVWTVNLVERQMEGCEKKVCEDISKKTSLKSQDFDIVFLGDIVEHLIEPDKVIVEASRILKPKSYLVITTPNLASLVNRVSLLLGFAPTNYHPSEKRFGTLFGVKESSWHKSVFTTKAMKDFLKSYGFKVLAIKGNTYQKTRLAKLMDACLPHSLSEGMIVIAQKEN